MAAKLDLSGTEARSVLAAKLDLSSTEASSTEAFLATTARAVAEALQQAAAEVSEEHRRLADKARSLEELRVTLDEKERRLERGSAQLDQDRARFEAECSREREELVGVRASASHAQATVDSVLSDVTRAPLCAGAGAAGTSALVAPSPSRLLRCPQEVLAAAFAAGGAEGPPGRGRLLVEFRPELFEAVLLHLEGAGQDLGGDTRHDRFQRMFAHYNLQGWVEQHSEMDAVGPSMAVRGRRYAVLPPADPSEASVLLDMYDSSVSVPQGWEVLTTGTENFSEVIVELTKHCWGTSLLCVRNAGGGFSSYRTILYTHGGCAGTRVSGDSRVLQAVDDMGRNYKFSKGMVLSGRLVICGPLSTQRCCAAGDMTAVR